MTVAITREYLHDLAMRQPGTVLRDDITDNLINALRRVLDLRDRHEHGALRWADPLPVPEWIADLDAALAGTQTDDGAEVQMSNAAPAPSSFVLDCGHPLRWPGEWEVGDLAPCSLCPPTQRSNESRTLTWEVTPCRRVNRQVTETA